MYVRSGDLGFDGFGAADFFAMIGSGQGGGDFGDFEGGLREVFEEPHQGLGAVGDTAAVAEYGLLAVEALDDPAELPGLVGSEPHVDVPGDIAVRRDLGDGDLEAEQRRDLRQERFGVDVFRGLRTLPTQSRVVESRAGPFALPAPTFSLRKLLEFGFAERIQRIGFGIHAYRSRTEKGRP